MALSLSVQELARRFDLSVADARRIRTNFVSHDADGSGTVDVDELGDILSHMGYNLEQEKLDQLMAEVGTKYTHMHTRVTSDECISTCMHSRMHGHS